MMRKRGLLVCLYSGCAVLAYIATSGAAGPIRYEHADKATIAGHKIELLNGMSLNIDCSTLGPAAFEVVTQPSHGRLSDQKERIFSNFRAPNPRVKCNGRKLPAIVMYYAPNPKYTGHDFAEVRIAYANGGVVDAKVDIDVK